MIDMPRVIEHDHAQHPYTEQVEVAVLGLRLLEKAQEIAKQQRSRVDYRHLVGRDWVGGLWSRQPGCGDGQISSIRCHGHCSPFTPSALVWRRAIVR